MKNKRAGIFSWS